MKNPQSNLLILLTCLFAVVLGGFLTVRNQSAAPVRISPLSAVVPAPTTQPRPLMDPEKININMASVDELMALPGIGETTATRIVEYRTEHGPFRSVVQLTNVSGIGEKKLAQIIDLITV